MRIEQGISRRIDQILIREDAERSALHESSRGLTASSLLSPSRQWLLKYIGIPRKTIDPYTLRKFARGRAVEDWYVDKLDKAGVLVAKQKEVLYRECKGFADAIVDQSELDFKDLGIIPHEVKSVTNAHFKRIKTTGEINHGYILQAVLYALGEGKSQCAVDVIASDDLRDHVVIFDVKDYKNEIDRLITEHQIVIENWKANHQVPDWTPREKWQDNPMYMAYDEQWARFSQAQFIQAVEEFEKMKV